MPAVANQRRLDTKLRLHRGNGALPLLPALQPVPGDYNCYCTAYDLDVQRQNMARDKPLVGRVTYANGDAQEFTDAEAFLKCVRDELPYRPTTGFRYEVLTDDPSVRKQVDDIVFDLYGEENPRQLEEYQKTPKQGMTMGGIK